MSRPWIGRWLIAVSALHTAVAVFAFHPVLLDIAKRGVFNTVGRDPMAGTAVWFTLFGAVLCIAGLAISALEQASPQALPRSLGWSLLALAVLGIVLMPASGFWLALPPALALLRRRPSAPLGRQAHA